LDGADIPELAKGDSPVLSQDFSAHDLVQQPAKMMSACMSMQMNLQHMP
jgi:hypothetical protein